MLTNIEIVIIFVGQLINKQIIKNIMNTITIQSAKQFKSFLNENRKNITEINGVSFGEVYPILEASNRYVSYYDVDMQTTRHLSAPFTIQTK